MKRQIMLPAPIGSLYISLSGSYVTRIAMSKDETVGISDDLTVVECVVKEQIEEYFNGKRKQFDFPYMVECGTPFQQKVWCELCKIPYGTTATYGDIAMRIGKRGASRAVGAACNRNPLLLLIPCHRVIGKGARLVGFACGVDVKSLLLEMEHSC